MHLYRSKKITARLPPKGTATYSFWLPLDDPWAETFKGQVHPQNDPPPFFSAQSTRNDPDPLSAKRQGRERRNGGAAGRRSSAERLRNGLWRHASLAFSCGSMRSTTILASSLHNWRSCWTSVFGFICFWEAVAHSMFSPPRVRTLYSLTDTIASRWALVHRRNGVSPVVALQLQLQTNVSQLMAIDKDALEIGDGEHASHARNLLRAVTDVACAAERECLRKSTYVAGVWPCIPTSTSFAWTCSLPASQRTRNSGIQRPTFQK